MQAVTVKNVTIGDGIPKICVPIVAGTKRDILADARKIINSKADIVEWRADWFEAVTDPALVAEVLRELSSILRNIPLLFTVRTAKEGGNLVVNPALYAKINHAAAETAIPDLVDVEVYSAGEAAKEIIDSVHAAGAKVIGSNHQFDKTPPTQEIIDRLRKIQEAGADICKIAVTPHSKADVLRLIEATLTMTETYADRPVAAISMTKSGVISRLFGEWFGSALTFGTVEKASAPGQIDAGELFRTMREFHNQIG